MAKPHYVAFISYRHLTPDQEIARKLHKLIETYTVPAALRKEGQAHPGKVFRDQDELPLCADLGRDIEEALENSEWLICVCSPQYLKSAWCMRELAYFISRKGRDRVLTVLSEGEPKDSFPESLCFDTDENGNRTEREPLAADVRGGSISESLKKLKKEKLRILAPILGATFDGLYQRQRRRALRSALAVSLSAVALLGGFLAYALVQNARISMQNEKIAAQNTELTEKNTQIQAQNEQIKEQNVRIEEERTAASQNECGLLIEKSVYYSSIDRKQEAAQLALDALAVSETLDHYAQDEIREALAVSCTMGDFAIEAELDFPGMKAYNPACFFSPDGKKIAVMDSRSGLTLCDANTGARLWVASPFSHDITAVQWNADSTLLAVTVEYGHTVCILDAANGERLHEARLPWPVNAVFDGESLLVAFSQGFVRWDPAVSDTDFPDWIETPENQFISSKTMLNGRFISRCEFIDQQIFVKDKGMDGCFVIKLENNKVISGYTLSPDGEWLYVHQFDLCMVISMTTDELRWKITEDEGKYTGADCGPVWVGDVILDCGTAYSAQTGEKLYTIDDECVGVSPDGAFFICQQHIYRTADGSKFADVPGKVRAVDASGTHLAVYKATDYGKGNAGDADTVTAREHRVYKELFPGNGSQYTVENYEGSLLEIPDWTEPQDGEGAEIAFSDPYLQQTAGPYLSKMFISPDTRFYLITNLGKYIPIYDRDKGGEPAFRVYDFSVGDHVEAADVSFSADSRYVAITGVNGNVAVYELETGRMVQSYIDLYGVRTLSEGKFNRAGNSVMVADFNRSNFRVYSVTNGQTLYIIHGEKEAAAWGFDEKTGDAVVCYTDGSARIARMFENMDELLFYARERMGE